MVYLLTAMMRLLSLFRHMATSAEDGPTSEDYPKKKVNSMYSDLFHSHISSTGSKHCFITMGRPGSYLQNSLDRDVYQVVRKLLDSETSGANGVSVSSVYDSIKKSNSSLKRKPKGLLEGSIDRVLSVLQEEEDSDSMAEEEARQQTLEPDHSNAMNRMIAKSMAPKKNQTEAEKLRADGEQMPSPAVSGTEKLAKKRTQQTLAERPAKRRKEEPSYAPPTHVSLADLGGMDSVVEHFKEHLMLPLRRPQRYRDRGLKIPRGILLHGPPGCGKTMLCEAVAAELGLPFIQIAAPSIVSGMSGESEKQLREHFDNAKKMAPCLMFIDEIDTITPKRESAQREMERRIVGQLLTCMDDLDLEKNDGKPVIVLAATNRPDSLDPALRRAGRFDTEVNIGVPNIAVREQILRAQTRRTEIAGDVDFGQLAKMTPGFVGADLESLVLKAGNVSNAKYIETLETRAREADARNGTITAEANDDNDVNMDEAGASPSGPKPSAAVISFRAINKLLLNSADTDNIPDEPITMSDFEKALEHIQPSAKREGFATIPETTWANIGALESVRKELVNAVVKPIQNPEKYARFGISFPAGVLLWGPPGCGKTLLAKAVANESKANFISVSGPELLNKYVGESERAVRQVFFRARSSVPCVIFFDELDALVPKRDDALSDASARVVNTLLTELDGISNRAGIYVIAATNRPDMIDNAMLRPGRLGKHLYVGLPGANERVEILGTIMKKMPVRDASLAEFARKCEHFTGADLSNLAYEAAQSAVQRDAEVLEEQDMASAAARVKPSVSVKELVRFTQLRETF